MFIGAYSYPRQQPERRKYRELDTEKRWKRRDVLRQELVDKRDVVRRASRETARRQRALEERKRSDEEAEMRRREEVLEQRRQQQREAMNMMRSCRRNGSGKTQGVERDVEVRFYSKGSLPKPLVHGVSKLNGVRVVQGSKVEMSTRPWKTHIELDDALRAVNSQRSKQLDIQDNRDSLEGSPVLPDDQQSTSLSLNAQNLEVNSRGPSSRDRSVGDGFTATFIRSHVVGHRAIQSSDLALEDIAPEDDVEGSGKDTTGVHLMSMAGNKQGVKQSVICGEHEVDLSVDSIDEVKLDGGIGSKPEEVDQKERGGKRVSDLMLCEETRSSHSDVSEQTGSLVMALVSQPITGQQSKKLASLETLSESVISHVTEDIVKKTHQIDLGKNHDTNSEPVPFTNSLNNSLHLDSKSSTLVEPRKTSLNKKEAPSLQVPVNSNPVNSKPDPSVKTHAMKSEKLTPALSPERNRGRDHLFMSSVVMNTPATSAVQAALSQYLAGRSSSMPSCKQSTLNGSKSHSLGSREVNRTDEQNDQQPVGVATKLGEILDFDGGFKLRETSSEQKLTGILKKPGGKRPSSANGVDMARPVDGSTGDTAKKTVRFADFRHNVKLISPSPVNDSPFLAYVKLKKKRTSSAPTERHTERSESFVARQEAVAITGVARKSSQSRVKQKGSQPAPKKVWESKSSSNGVFSVKITGYGKDKRDKLDVESKHEMALDELDPGESISLEKTPTDDEIDQLWTTVRTRLQYESNNNTVKGIASLRSVILESRKGSTESLCDGHDAGQGIQPQTDTYHVCSRSQLTNRPTMAAPTLDQTIGWESQRTTSQTPAVSHSQSNPSFVQAVYSDSVQTMGRPPAYVRHYQQQAELALMRGSARAPTAVRSYRFPSKSGETGTSRGSGERVGVRERHSQATLNGKKPMTELSIEEMQVLKSLERLNSKLDEKQAVLQSAHNTVGASTMTVKTIQPQPRQKTTPSVGAPYQASIHRRTLSNMPKTRVRRNPHAIAAAAMAAAQSQNSRTQPHVPIHRQAFYNM